MGIEWENSTQNYYLFSLFDYHDMWKSTVYAMSKFICEIAIVLMHPNFDDFCSVMKPRKLDKWNPAADHHQQIVPQSNHNIFLDQKIIRKMEWFDDNHILARNPNNVFSCSNKSIWIPKFVDGWSEPNIHFFCIIDSVNFFQNKFIKTWVRLVVIFFCCGCWLFHFFPSSFLACSRCNGIFLWVGQTQILQVVFPMIKCRSSNFMVACEVFEKV